MNEPGSKRIGVGASITSLLTVKWPQEAISSRPRASAGWVGSVSGDVSEDNPLYGLFRFKQGFGGDFTEFVGEEDLVLSPVIYWAVEHGTSVFKDLRKTVYLIKNRGKK